MLNLSIIVIYFFFIFSVFISSKMLPLTLNYSKQALSWKDQKEKEKGNWVHICNKNINEY